MLKYSQDNRRKLCLLYGKQDLQKEVQKEWVNGYIRHYIVVYIHEIYRQFSKK